MTDVKGFLGTFQERKSMFVVQKRRKDWSIFFNSVCLFLCKAYGFLNTESVNFIISNYGEVLISSWRLLFHGQIFSSLFIPPIKTYVSEFEWSLLLKSTIKPFARHAEKKILLLFILSVLAHLFSSLKWQMILHINPEMNLCCFWFCRALLEDLRFKCVFMMLLSLHHILLAWWCYLRRYLKWHMERQGFTNSQNSI